MVVVVVGMLLLILMVERCDLVHATAAPLLCEGRRVFSRLQRGGECFHVYNSWAGIITCP